MCRVSQVCAAVVVVVVLVAATDLVAVAEAKPDPSQLANMAEALKYLQELDKYYSQVSRPSPRSAPGPASQIQALENTLKFLQLQELGKLYSLRARPRFGKRSDYPMPSGDALMEASERLLETLARRR
uniref:Preproneuropeptide F II n=1 Tax=Penaeus marginatus TaxID=162039 RepID=F6KM65_9EUCA|nr:preproneuropeptide F II [Penaeus marginatus]